MKSATQDLAPGLIARVRQRTYLIEQVIKPKRARDSTLVRMSCVDDDAQGQPLDALWEKEIDAEIVTGENWDSIAQKGLDNPSTFSAYLNTCLLYTSPSPRDRTRSRMPSSA